MAIVKIKKANTINHDALMKVLSTFGREEVLVKYDLVTTSNVSLRTMYIGFTEIELTKDQNPLNRNHFRTSDSKSYKCTVTDTGLKVQMIASGMEGDYWELKIKIRKQGATDYTDLSDNPIFEQTGSNGTLDHSEYHK